MLEKIIQHLNADCSVKQPGTADAVSNHMHLEAHLCGKFIADT